MNPSSSSSTDPGDTVVYPATATLPVFYTVIPASIRRRFPRLYYSLHKSFRSSSNNADSNGKNNSHELNAHGLTSASEPQLAYYRESIVSGVANEVAAGTSAPAPGSPQHPLTAHSTTSNGYDLDREGSLSSVDTDNNSNSSSVSVSEGGEGLSTATGNSATATKYETGSGLRWNRVVPAFNLLRSAGYEAQQNNPDSHLVRSLYINALVYLLTALPQDLSTEEANSIQDTLPDKVKSAILPPPAQQASQFQNTAGFSGPEDKHYMPTRPSPERSYLHRLLASSIIQCFLLLQFLLPYIKILLHQLYQYERSHRIIERVIAATLDAADSLGKGSVNLGSAILSLNEGKVGAAVSNLGAWWVEGIAGGIYEGVGEGMVLLGIIRSTHSNSNSNPEFEFDGNFHQRGMSMELASRR